VIPGSKASSVLSAKDLKPKREILESCIEISHPKSLLYANRVENISRTLP
jgi:hypothetical protein